MDKDLGGDDTQQKEETTGKVDKVQFCMELEKLERPICNLTKKNVEMEDKFVRVANFLVCIMHSTSITLLLM